MPIVTVNTVDGALITTLADATEVHPAIFVTEYVYVPAGISVIVLLVPEPMVVTAPGFLVNVQVIDVGKPLNSTLPVGSVEVGCVIAPIIGAVIIG